LSLLSDFNGTYFSKYFRKISDFMKILPVGANLFHAGRQMERERDGETDKDEANNRFLQKWCGCSHATQLTKHRCILIDYFNNCNFSKHE